jgi:hypothetical protein
MVKDNKSIEEKTQQIKTKQGREWKKRMIQCQQVLNCITGGSSPSFPHEFIKGKWTIR